jgi:hypothetical protein
VAAWSGQCLLRRVVSFHCLVQKKKGTDHSMNCGVGCSETADTTTSSTASNEKGYCM